MTTAFSAFSAPELLRIGVRPHPIASCYFLLPDGGQGNPCGVRRCLDRRHAPARSLSRVFVPEPDTLLMDEPLRALNAQMRRVGQEEQLALWDSKRPVVRYVKLEIENKRN